MKKILLSASLLFISIAAFSQSGTISLEDIWQNYAYFPNYIDDLRSMNDGEHYSVNNNGTLEKYEYKTGNKTEDIFNVSMTNNALQNFDDYAFNYNETEILLSAETEPRYRWATFNSNYVYDIKKKTTTKLSEKGKQMYADFAPAGNRIAYVINNNLFYKDLNTNTEYQITTDGQKNSIINGGSDWVYEEEFTLVRSFEWSPDGNKIAYYRFDETEVPEYSIPFYEDSIYPRLYEYKYPKVGEKNSKIEIYIYDMATQQKIKVNTGNAEYIPRIKWIDKNNLSIQLMNRLQNDLRLITVNANSGNTKELMRETAEKYIEIKDDLTFLENNAGFIWSSEKDGYNHLYYYNMNGKLVNQITKGNWDVTEFKGYDEKTKTLFYISAEDSPMQRQLYSVKLNGKEKKKITTLAGENAVDFSKGYKYFINTYSNLSTPYSFSLYQQDGKLIRVLENNTELNTKLANLKISKPELFNFTTSDGVSLNGYMIKPADFDATKKYPVFMYVYGGPGIQTVVDGWNGQDYMWFQMLAQNGYIIVSVDNRGTGARGRDFRQVTYKQLGKYETDDQIEAAKWLGKQKYVDASRIGIFGWSYGGYMAGLCITRGADVFKAAISVAPVTNWKYYDNIYTERYMGTLQTNPNGYDDNAPIAFADKLKGKYLIVHGTGDDNVHFQNSAEFINALVKNNKQFQLMVYPNRNHGIYGGSTRMHLYTLMTNFIYDNL